MAEHYKLSPTSAKRMTLDISDVHAPYIDEWHAERAKTGETLTDFLVRMLVVAAHNHRLGKCNNAAVNEHDRLKQAEIDLLQSDHAIEVNR